MGSMAVDYIMQPINRSRNQQIEKRNMVKEAQARNIENSIEQADYSGVDASSKLNISNEKTSKAYKIRGTMEEK